MSRISGSNRTGDKLSLLGAGIESQQICSPYPLHDGGARAVQ